MSRFRAPGEENPNSELRWSFGEFDVSEICVRCPAMPRLTSNPMRASVTESKLHQKKTRVHHQWGFRAPGEENPNSELRWSFGEFDVSEICVR
jgi:hypothetical protein